MNKITLILIICFLSVTLHAETKSPYIGQDIREIKALSKQEIEGYLNGKGLGYAKAAELNKYPGPRHVLDLAKELSLSKEQSMKTKEVFFAMEQQAKKHGEKLVKKEQELDQEFVSNSINPDTLERLLTDIGILESKN